MMENLQSRAYKLVSELFERGMTISEVEEYWMNCVSLGQALHWLESNEGNFNLECDGMSRVVSYVLAQQGIKHKRVHGRAIKGKNIYHEWVDLENGFIIDYRLRMWFGENVHHGYVAPDNTSGVIYDPMSESPVVFNEELFLILTNGTPFVLSV